MKYRITKNFRGKWVVHDWMAISEHDTEDEARTAAKRYEENEYRIKLPFRRSD